jgi:hydrogenase expression/formation protein HypD
MKYLNEFRSEGATRRLWQAIHREATRPWSLMEVCGGQTHTIVKMGIEDLLPESITLVHGPGCPVCVTPTEVIDAAVNISLRPETVLCSFGDMLRVPGSSRSLLQAKSEGAQVRMVYSPLDAVRFAKENPRLQIVFFAVGFETTAPANAMAVWQAAQQNISNFSILVAHVLVPPAMRLILDSPDCRVQAFLAPGHVCTVAGYKDYEAISTKYRVPIVVTGFEPVDILQGILLAVRQLEGGEASVENPYSRVVRREGNAKAQEIVRDVFEVADQNWRGIGIISGSGLSLRPAYRRFDAMSLLDVPPTPTVSESRCISGLVLQGLKKPYECPSFGTACTPESPLGAPMVSSEGACAAYYMYARHKHGDIPTQLSCPVK